eukprot:9433456-Prorocentrum_lima.AAC.1
MPVRHFTARLSNDAPLSLVLAARKAPSSASVTSRSLISMPRFSFTATCPSEASSDEVHQEGAPPHHLGGGCF